MATVRIGSAAPVDMRNDYTTYGAVRIATSTQIEIVAGPYVWDYFGQGFTYSPNGVVGGTLTGYSQTYNGGLVVTATGLNVAAATAYQLIQSNNDIQLDAIALNGNDTIYGAGDSDVLMGFGGNNTIIGVPNGVDYAAYSGAASAYSISVNSSGFAVSRPDGGQDELINIKAIKFSDQTISLSPAPPPTHNGLIGLLNVSQLLEMVYVAYFNRAADSTGFNFWQGQNREAVAAGQSTGQVLAEIANSFTPQPETFALYPFLSTPNLNLKSPASLAGLTRVVTAIYGNLFNRAPDAAGLSYWVHNLSTGAIPLGEAVLAIANGALGSDVTEILNKITVALDFTTRTGTAGSLVNAPATLLAAARSVLHGVDSTSPNDASVTAGENATTAYIHGATTNSDTIIVSTSNTVIDPGAGSHTIQFIAGAHADTVVLHSGGTDQIAGFDLAGGDRLDVRTLLAEAHLTSQGVLPNLGAYFTIADQGSNAVLRFDSTGHGGGSAVAILDNLGSVVMSLHAVQI